MEKLVFIFFLFYAASAVIVTVIKLERDEVIDCYPGILVDATIVNGLAAYLAYRLADVSTSSTRYTVLYCIWGYLLISWLLAANKVWRGDVVRVTSKRFIIIDLMMAALLLGVGSLAGNW